MGELCKPIRKRFDDWLEAEPDPKEKRNEAKNHHSGSLLKANGRCDKLPQAVALNHPCRPEGIPPELR